MKFLIYFLTFIQLLAVNLEAAPVAPAFEQSISQKAERIFIEDVEQAPLILGNHDLSYNSLQGSVYEC